MRCSFSGFVGFAASVAVCCSTAMGQGRSLFGNRGPASQPSATMGDAGTPPAGSSLFPNNYANTAPAQGPNISGQSGFGFFPNNAYGFRGGAQTGPAATGIASTPGNVAASPTLAGSAATTPATGGPFRLFRAPTSPIGQGFSGRGMFAPPMGANNSGINSGSAFASPRAPSRASSNVPNVAGAPGVAANGFTLPWVDLAAQAGPLPYQHGPIANEYAGFQGVTYDQSGSILTLRGQVSSPADRRLLLQIANFEPGVSSVLNEVTVAPQPGTVAGPLPVGTYPTQPTGAVLPTSPIPAAAPSAIPATAPAPSTP